ncbi:MAG: transglycosylase SLT domain-containing protein [Candidatus Dormibacteraeota bacterium]|jgi:hypothetical protein|nr:transglycosylase SLT domain-containing protein [Candidatus Dormibacteraeota bacterium]
MALASAPGSTAISLAGLTPTEETIVKVAESLGVDPRLALAIAYQESGMNPKAVGDNGTSFGLYQLHQGGELGSNSPTWAFNPVNNATRALSQVALVAKLHPGWSPGAIAAAAQRPANPVAYADSVNAIYASSRWRNVPGTGGGQVSATAPSASNPSPTGCAFGVGPFCIFSQAGLQRFYGALLMGAGGLVITVGLGLVVIGALAETKAGRVASKTFGAAGLGAVVGAAAAPSRAVGERRTRRAAATQQAQAESQRAAQQQASQAHQAALRRAQLRSARARARRAEEGVRTQRAITQGRADSADIRQYEQTEGRARRRTAVESRAAGRRLEAQNKRSVAQRQKFIDVFGETG